MLHLSSPLGMLFYSLLGMLCLGPRRPQPSHPLARAGHWRALASGLQAVYRTYGDPEAVLELCAGPALPAAARLEPNAVNVRFLAASINPADINQIQGRARPLRAGGGWRGGR
jgi:hypothetical protein